ncbi:MAG TPA: M42 family metallopeptidase [Limnochordia bacterium]|nr:M42 family metallopeptidase [Limnochordia bacterium]
MRANDELYHRLTEAPGVPGDEGAVRALMREQLAPLGEIVTDRLGSIAVRAVGSAGDPKILVLGHMDEVGFMVNGITEGGFLRFQTLGGWWEQVMLAQRVEVHTASGPLVGVIGSKPPHILPADERKKPVEKREMFIDIGAVDKADALRLGVRPGDMVVPVCPFAPLGDGDLMLAKAWDDRAGCAVAIRLAQALARTEHPNTVIVGASVQEEVGLRGAGTMAQLVEPHVGIALDVAIAGDTPGVKPEESDARLGGGPVLLLYDASMVSHVGLRRLVVDTAAAIGIPLQFQTLPGGGYDTGKIHTVGAGAPSVALAVAARYIHSSGSVVHRRDLDQLVELLVALVKRLDATAYAQLIG